MANPGPPDDIPARRAAIRGLLPAMPSYPEIQAQLQGRFGHISDRTIRDDMRAIRAAEKLRREEEGTAELEDIAYRARLAAGYRAALQITDPAVKSRELRHWAVYDSRYRGLGTEAAKQHPILGELQDLLTAHSRGDALSEDDETEALEALEALETASGQ